MNNQDKDYKWFMSNLQKLFREYGYAYLAIKDEKVLGAYDNYAQGVKETLKTEPLGSFIVQQCAPDDSFFTVKVASLLV